jgi:type II secretory ATPase GspE/PulE/Tfp pilus assembly ATPase PilB-like protein
VQNRTRLPTSPGVSLVEPDPPVDATPGLRAPSQRGRAPLHRRHLSRIRITAELDIAERRVPQGGRVALNVDGRSVDVRLATLPLVGGESAVLRVRDKARRSSTSTRWAWP